MARVLTVKSTRYRFYLFIYLFFILSDERADAWSHRILFAHVDGAAQQTKDLTLHCNL